MMKMMSGAKNNKKTKRFLLLLHLGLLLLLLLLAVTGADAFARPSSSRSSRSSGGGNTPVLLRTTAAKNKEKELFPISLALSTRIVTNINRGGASESTTTTTSLNSAMTTMMIPSAIETALKAGPWGVVALTGVASSVVLPLTMYRQGYSFSVGYGFSVFAMGFAIFQTFDNIGFSRSTLASNPLSLLALVVMLYGARLGSFLLLREFTVPSKQEQIKSFDKSPRLKRVPLALGVSMFYAFMTSPLLFAARAGLESNVVMNVGLVLAWLGAGIEAITDGQKFLVKQSAASKNEEDKKFVGPTGGFYRLCRHPNYFAEVLFWFGLAVAGAPSFGTTNPILAWTIATLGFYGIFSIMSGAAKRLDGKQQEKYSGQVDYEKYKKEVPASLWPWMRGDSS